GGLDEGADTHLLRDAAEPGESRRRELRPLAAAEQRLEHHARRESGDRRAVLGGDVVEVVDRLEAAGARHVLRDELGVAGDMAAHMARERARIEVVAAAGAEADEERNRLAGIEVGFGRRRRYRQSKAGRKPSCEPSRERDQDGAARDDLHAGPLMPSAAGRLGSWPPVRGHSAATWACCCTSTFTSSSGEAVSSSMSQLLSQA